MDYGKRHKRCYSSDTGCFEYCQDYAEYLWNTSAFATKGEPAKAKAVPEGEDKTCRVPTIVIVAGGFDGLHLGHIDHLTKARILGDTLIAITHPDERLIQKKGFCLWPVHVRSCLLERYVDIVMIDDIDTDGTIARALVTLRQKYSNNIIVFAKGGDRTESNMPAIEITTCNKYDIKLVYGIGDLLDSSTCTFKRAVRQWAINRPKDFVTTVFDSE